MRCASCGAGVSVENVFPGGSVRCACGATATVPSGVRASEERPSAVAAAVVPSTNAHATRCPRCPAELVVRDEDGVVVAACPSHHGLFVTHRALVALVDAAALGPPVVDAPAVACPRCLEPMTARTFGRDTSIVVDVCEQHGTWFDAGELRDATRSAREETRPSATAGSGEDVTKKAAATLDVALALEEARDEETARRTVDLADDLVDTFNFFVLGRTRSSVYGRRYR